MFIIRGECQHSGRCCLSIMVYDNAQPIQSMHNWGAFYGGFQNMIPLNPIMLRVILHLMIVIV